MMGDREFTDAEVKRIMDAAAAALVSLQRALEVREGVVDTDAMAVALGLIVRATDRNVVERGGKSGAFTEAVLGHVETLNESLCGEHVGEA